MKHIAKPLFAATVAATMLLAFAPASMAADTGDLAVSVLDTLTVAPQTDDYKANTDRPDDWAQANDNPGDYSTTRDTILARDLTDVTYNDRHQVATGTLHDPYTGNTIDFQRGQGTSNTVQIDHVVAFGEAWESGLDDDGEQTIERYYNDPYVLLAVDGPSNGGKQDSDAAEWLPSKVDADGKDTYDCYYVARQVGIKAKYDLSVDEAEKTAMEDVLATCPAQTIPSESDGAYWDSGETDDTMIGDVDGDGRYTTGDLAGMAFIVDGRPLDGFDPNVHDYTLTDGDHDIHPDGMPDGWTCSATTATTPGGVASPARAFTVTIASPDGTHRERYTFRWNAAEQTGEDTDDGDHTPDIAFTVNVNGVPLDGFDPDVHEYAVSDPTAVEFTGLPDGWTVEHASEDGVETYTLRDPNGNATGVYRFNLVDVTQDTDPPTGGEPVSGPDAQTPAETDGPTDDTLAQTGANPTTAATVMLVLLAAAIPPAVLRRRDAGRG